MTHCVWADNDTPGDLVGFSIDKIEDPKGDRVVVTYNGKFLPYRKW